MPLIPNLLSNNLSQIDDTPNQSIPDVAGKWFNAWWQYAQGMVFLTPGGAGQTLVQAPFIGALTGGLTFNAAPIAFFLALETAMRTSWGILGTPVGLLSPAIAAIPAPVPLAPILLSTVAIGMPSAAKAPVRAAMASIIDTWTRLFIAVGPTGPIGPFT